MRYSLLLASRTCSERPYIGEPLGGFGSVSHDVYNVWARQLVLGIYRRGSGKLLRGDINKAVFTR
jgi:hypothetical protein